MERMNYGGSIDGAAVRSSCPQWNVCRAPSACRRSLCTQALTSARSLQATDQGNETQEDARAENPEEGVHSLKPSSFLRAPINRVTKGGGASPLVVSGVQTPFTMLT